jgi:outer membrane protein
MGAVPPKLSVLLFFLLMPPFAAAQSQRSAPLALTLKRAVEIALAPEGNTRLRLAEESVVQAKSQSGQARSALLPKLEGYVTEQNLTRNLAALGIGFRIPGVQIPTFVGPFDLFDARVTANASIIDFSSFRNYQASKAGLASARSDRDNTAEQVAADVAKAYLQILRARAQVEAVQADIEVGEAILKTAEDQKNAGTGTGLDVVRARVELANVRQRLLVAQNNQSRSQLLLLRAMNLKLDTDIDLTDSLRLIPVDPAFIDRALDLAMENRQDLKAQEQREERARLSASATSFERAPSLAFIGDYGTIGPSITSAVPTRSYGASLRVPVFDGGRREARRSESESQFRQQHVRTDDLRQEIELQVRTAIDNLRSAEAQVQVAEEGLTLSDAELAQARRRFEAGVGTSLEVTDAQSRLERARDNRIEALFSYNQARIDLGVATGTAGDMVQQ